MCFYNIKRKRESIVLCSNQIQPGPLGFEPSKRYFYPSQQNFYFSYAMMVLNYWITVWKAVSFSYFTERILSSVSTRVSHSTQSTPDNPDSGPSRLPRHPEKCFSLQQRSLLKSMYFIPDWAGPFSVRIGRNWLYIRMCFFLKLSWAGLLLNIFGVPSCFVLLSWFVHRSWVILILIFIWSGAACHQGARNQSESPSYPTDVDGGPKFVRERGAAVIRVAGQGASVLELSDRLDSRPRYSGDCADAC